MGMNIRDHHELTSPNGRGGTLLAMGSWRSATGSGPRHLTCSARCFLESARRRSSTGFPLLDRANALARTGGRALGGGGPLNPQARTAACRRRGDSIIDPAWVAGGA